MANTENKDPKKELKKRMVKALYSYSPVNIDELSLKVNDILEVIEETEEGWWKGILDGTVGMFPSNFVVELDVLPEDLNNKLTNELSPTKNSSKAKNINQQEPLNRHENNILIENKQDSKQGMMNSNTSDIIDGSSSSKSISNLPSEKKPVITKQKPSADSSAPRLPPKPVREQALVLYPYESRNEDELTLKEGDIITILSKDIEDKGWWRGELSNRVGVFPDNFVRLIKAEEQKKPERPDKPAAVLSSKSSSKSVLPEKSTTESSPKVDKKVVKTPPAKPPPPEIHKKEPDRPLPPFPTKKPQPPQPVKKPMRSSLGTKPASSQASTINSLKSSHSGSASSIIAGLSASLEKNEESTKHSETPLEKGKQGEEELEFDAVESSAKKLVHLTANRAKAPNRRPPSFIFLKEGEKEIDLTKDSRRRSEPLLAEIKTLLPLSDSEKKNSVSSTDMKPKVPPTRPSLPIVRNNSLSKHDTAAFSKGSNVTPDAVVKPQENGKKDMLSEKVPILTKDVLQPKVSEPSNVPAKPAPPNIAKPASNINAKVPTNVPMKVTNTASKPPDIPTSNAFSTNVPTKVTNTASKPPDIPTSNAFSTNVPTAPNVIAESAAKMAIKVSCNATPRTASVLPSKVISDPSVAVDTEVHASGDNVKMIMNNMVSKNEHNALVKQVTDLKDSLEQLYKMHNKAISDLKEELDEEKRLRCAIELELQKLKERQNT